MRDTLLGYDGLPSDETVTSYRVNEHGILLKYLWGGIEMIQPEQAIRELESALKSNRRLIKLDPLARDRVANIEKAIQNIRAWMRENQPLIIRAHWHEIGNVPPGCSPIMATPHGLELRAYLRLAVYWVGNYRFYVSLPQDSERLERAQRGLAHWRALAKYLYRLYKGQDASAERDVMDKIHQGEG